MKRKKKLPLLKREDRTCGECFACCYVLAIQDIPVGKVKPAGQDCPHLARESEHPCSIYAERPRTCVDYQCAWVREAGFGDVEHRPDKIGVLFTPRDNKWEVEPFAGPFTLIAHETRAGAYAEEAAANFMEHVAGHFIVLAFHGPKLDKCRFMGPANKILAVSEWCQEHGYSQPTSILKGATPSLDDQMRRRRSLV